jgi:hypothetical protein
VREEEEIKKQYNLFSQVCMGNITNVNLRRLERIKKITNDLSFDEEKEKQ